MSKNTMRDEIPPGRTYMLILKTLARLGEMHGFEIANSIQQISEDVLQVEEGSLYPALQRMLVKGWVEAEWKQSENNRRARSYRMTSAGPPGAANNWPSGLASSDALSQPSPASSSRPKAMHELLRRIRFFFHRT